ncbi:MAG: PAS domain S-box protein [bacterium]
MFTDLQGRIQDVNHAILEMTSYSRDELLAMTFQQLTPPKWHAMEEEIVRTRILATGSSGEYEKEYARKDGTVIPVALSVWLQRDESGKPVGMWGTVRDSSERRRTEDEVRRKMAEIEKLNRFMIGREERIIEVKREVNELLTRHGQPPKYKV